MDYTPYLFNYNEKPQKEIKPQNKLPKNRWAIVLIVLIILSLIVSLYLIGRFKNEDLFSLMVSAVTKKDVLSYYLVVTEPYEYKDEAIIKSTHARVSGGAGYIHLENNNYFVALATFLEVEKAKEVSDKNEGTSVIELKINKTEVFSSLKNDALMRECYELLEGVILTLDELIKNYENKEINLTDTLHTLEKKGNELLNFKKKVLDSKCDYKDVLLNKINPPLGGIEAITSATSHNNLTSEMRYVECATAVEICRE